MVHSSLFIIQAFCTSYLHIVTLHLAYRHYYFLFIFFQLFFRHCERLDSCDELGLAGVRWAPYDGSTFFQIFLLQAEVIERRENPTQKLSLRLWVFWTFQHSDIRWVPEKFDLDGVPLTWFLLSNHRDTCFAVRSIRCWKENKKSLAQRFETLLRKYLWKMYCILRGICSSGWIPCVRFTKNSSLLHLAWINLGVNGAVCQIAEKNTCFLCRKVRQMLCAR